MDKKSLEKRYGITIADDSYLDPISGKKKRMYKMYTADGCLWENGLKDLTAVNAECIKWQESILSIKDKKESEDIKKMSYDELIELQTNLTDMLDDRSLNSHRHNEVYFKLEKVYDALKEKGGR